MFPKTAVLIVSHNRRTQTLSALRSLSCSSYAEFLTAILYDDGSLDGTVEEVLDIYPGTIVLRGNGTAFWNRGLYEAWRRAAALDVDAFFWLNDDVELDPNALEEIADAWKGAIESGWTKFIIVGAVRGADGTITYSGHNRAFTPFAFRLKKIAPNGALQRVETFNGNIVIVSRGAFEALGTNDPSYFHNFGDTDYGLRATEMGIPIVLLPQALGRCEINLQKMKYGYGSPMLSLFEQWAIVNGHHGLPAASWLRLTRRHSFRFWLFHFLLPYRHLIIPRWLRRIGRDIVRRDRAIFRS